ncbi:ATP-binding protein (plasmid) [Synechococcus elongatus PCC 11801]|uniref:ATP-binding protein n=1 Tax=Synechococcus elongatus PCC 11801 TaxID=2219813 RepID=A0ACD5A2Y0_SYNEL
MTIPKKQHEAFAKFFEEPTRVALRNLLKDNIGETDNLDFKEAWPESTKLAKHILAMANSGGGVIIVGIKQSDKNSLEAIGVQEIKDKSDIFKQFRSYIPSEVSLEILDFSYQDSEYEKIKNKSFQVLIVDYNPEILPLLAKKTGKEIKQNCVYIRKGTNSEEANHEELQRLINSRIETGYSSSKSLELSEHLDQLKTLDLARPRIKSKILPAGDSFLKDFFNFHHSQDYNDFVENLYHQKKRVIEREIGI